MILIVCLSLLRDLVDRWRRRPQTPPAAFLGFEVLPPVDSSEKISSQ
jgi:hypothetical protein